LRKLALVASAVVVLAGCGGKSSTHQPGAATSAQTTSQPQQSKAAYASALIEAAKSTNREGARAMAELKANKPNAIADLKASVAHFHDRLTKITPPSDVTKQHKALIAASADLTKQFSTAVDKQKNKTYAAMKPLTDLKRYPAGHRIVQITAQINAKGYKFG
jgi:predicted small lipoprotein YifL